MSWRFLWVLACGCGATVGSAPVTETEALAETTADADGEAQTTADADVETDADTERLAMALAEAERLVAARLEGANVVSPGVLATLSAWGEPGTSRRVFIYEQDRDGLGFGRGCRPHDARIEDDGLHVAAHVQRRGRERCFDEIVLGERPWNAGGVCEGPDGGSATGDYHPSSYILVETTDSHAVFSQNVRRVVMRCAPRTISCEGGSRCSRERLEASLEIDAPNAMTAYARSAAFEADCEASCPAPDVCASTLREVQRSVGDHHVVDSEEPVLAVFTDRAACRAYARSRGSPRSLLEAADFAEDVLNQAASRQ